MNYNYITKTFQKAAPIASVSKIDHYEVKSSKSLIKIECFIEIEKLKFISF